MNLGQLIQNIEQWAHDRNIIKGSKPIDQAMKLFSEFGELADNVGKGRDCRDDIGDVFVVLTIMTAQHGHSIDDHLSTCGKGYNLKGTVLELCENLIVFANAQHLENEDVQEALSMATCLLESIALQNLCSLKECVQLAYNDIKDRKGILWNGVFVKESDSSYNACVKAFNESINEKQAKN